MAYFSSINLIILLILFRQASAITTIYNVINFGAKADGVTEATSAFIGAWRAACNSSGGVEIIVPKGRYLVGPMVFGGGCSTSTITMRIDGSLVAPVDFRVLGGAASWLSFEGVGGVSVVGGGFLDAKGSALWACKASKDAANCPAGATTLSFTNSNNIVIRGITSLNSQMFHIVINGCQSVHIQDVKIIATGTSPNTDGIHIQLSRDVSIINSSIKTGDDCISIGPGTKNLWAELIACGPGHGISIGSLAKDLEEQGVQNVTVWKAVLTDTTNGLRIKSWARPSTGFVQEILFQNVLMRNVQNPILIDQNYCPRNKNCPDQESGVRVNNVTYRGIRGTSATQVAVKFDCSPTSPCSGITLQNVNLTYLDQAGQSSCNNVDGMALGLVLPKSCL